MLDYQKRVLKSKACLSKTNLSSQLARLQMEIKVKKQKNRRIGGRKHFYFNGVLFILLFSIAKQCSIKILPIPITMKMNMEVTLTEHDFADTINLLLSIGEQTVTAINSEIQH
jgi:hypothetical protein